MKETFTSDFPAWNAPSDQQVCYKGLLMHFGCFEMAVLRHAARSPQIYEAY